MSLTIKNLESALAGESQAHIKYRYFARLARAEGYEEVAKHFTELVTLVGSVESDMYLVAKMKEMVPEFVSNNSVFEKLDTTAKVVGIN
jgi:rubrerythrin